MHYVSIFNKAFLKALKEIVQFFYLIFKMTDNKYKVSLWHHDHSPGYPVVLGHMSATV